MELSTNIPTERIFDLLTGAFEGGSNYWCKMEDDKQDAEYLNRLPDYLIGGAKNPKAGCQSPYILMAWDHSIVLTEIDEGHLPNGDVDHILNREKIEAGMKMMQETCPHHFNDFMAENDDAWTSDCLLQLALLQEYRYG